MAAKRSRARVEPGRCRLVVRALPGRSCPDPPAPDPEAFPIELTGVDEDWLTHGNATEGGFHPLRKPDVVSHRRRLCCPRATDSGAIRNQPSHLCSANQRIKAVSYHTNAQTPGAQPVQSFTVDEECHDHHCPTTVARAAALTKCPCTRTPCEYGFDVQASARSEPCGTHRHACLGAALSMNHNLLPPAAQCVGGETRSPCCWFKFYYTPERAQKLRKQNQKLPRPPVTTPRPRWITPTSCTPRQATCARNCLPVPLTEAIALARGQPTPEIRRPRGLDLPRPANTCKML